MDEEFFFPQNVRTTYRLWILGPKHLRRLALVPVIALPVGLALYRVSLVAAAAVAALLASAYAALWCIPLLGEEQTLGDVGLELLRHRRSQGYFAHRKEVDDHPQLEHVALHWRSSDDDGPPWDVDGGLEG